jgi:hypothetical protein
VGHEKKWLTRSDIAAVPGVDIVLIGSSDLTSEYVFSPLPYGLSKVRETCDTPVQVQVELTSSMGIPGEFDSPRLTEAYEIVSAACKKASKDGRVVSLGIGGLK